MNIKNELVKVMASDGADHQYFGESVVVSQNGKVIVVGTDSSDNNTASVYIYTHDDDKWMREVKLIENDGVGDDEFDVSIDVSANGDTVVVGIGSDNNEIGLRAGAVYIYCRVNDNWNEHYKLTVRDGCSLDYFGHSVAISADGNTIVVGAWGHDRNKGAVYIYSRFDNRWCLEDKLVMNDGKSGTMLSFFAINSGDYFGCSVDISDDGNTVIVGAYRNDNVNGDSAGSAYIYTRRNGKWVDDSKLIAVSGGHSLSCYGYSVAISGDGNTAIIGAYSEDNRRGSAYIYTRTGDTWSEQVKLVANDGASIDWFGYSVAISSDGNTAIVGAHYGSNGKDTKSGSAYVYTRSGSTWNEQAKLLASDGASYDYFGVSVSISGDGNTAIVGAYADDNKNGDSAGSAYIFDLT